MDICDILKKSKTIAVVGISSNSSRTSRMIADYLVNEDYIVVGVNPGKPKIGGMEVYAKLEDVPFEIDIVNVFRKSEDIPQIIPDVLAVKPKVLWLQLGIANNEAVLPCIEQGITVIQNKCIKIEHSYCY
ncbi:MAG: CoA-binding protein [Bacteroidetes bacterium]|nr:CoA-binding protein [Bacteroidota bacterium]MBU1114615.1 CoA-binding protein [Bacteroidota bacterium]MBU1797815.1 CoA-binding protein [Bacteroidota bacterium]